MNYAIVLAAGSGSRMNSSTPKQFIDVKGIPLFAYSVSTFANHPEIDGIVIVTSQDSIDRVEGDCKELGISKIIGVIPGGKERKDSVYNALVYLYETGVAEDDVILIHDCARPLISSEIISENIYQCKKYGAVDTAVPSIDTVMIAKDGIISSIPNRSTVYASQTPQTFIFDIIFNAHLNTGDMEGITDDCMLVLSKGFNIHIVNGSYENFKVTTPEDLNRLNILLETYK